MTKLFQNLVSGQMKHILKRALRRIRSVSTKSKFQKLHAENVSHSADSLFHETLPAHLQQNFFINSSIDD